MRWSLEGHEDSRDGNSIANSNLLGVYLYAKEFTYILTLNSPNITGMKILVW